MHLTVLNNKCTAHIITKKLTVRVNQIANQLKYMYV